MARIILISAPYLSLYGKLSKAAGRYFPLGIGYIAAYLKKYGGHDVCLYEPEAQNISLTNIVDMIDKQSPDIVGISTATPNFFNAVRLAKAIKQRVSTKIVLGGVHASAMPNYILEKYSDCIDYVIIGEGEQAMLELVSAISKNQYTLSEIKGVAYRKNSEVHISAALNNIEDLDLIPFPARDLISQDLFVPNMHNARYRKCATILTSRGCPYNCSYCASRIVSGKKYRMHSADYVISEIEMLKKDYGIRQMLITDDTFTINKTRLVDICNKMINRKLRLKWFCFSQVNTIDKEILRLMKKAGCYSIGFGVESSDEGTLKKMGKPIKPSDAVRIVNIANKLGLKTQAFYILGSPGETKKQMIDTIKFSKKVNATLSFYNMLVPYPGTKDFDYFFPEKKYDEIDWESFVAVGEECVLKNQEVSSTEIKSLIAKANIQYYLYPKRVFNMLYHIRSGYEFRNYLKGGMSLFNQILSWKRSIT